MGELFCLAIKLVEPSAIGADPDDSLPACVKGVSIIIAQAVRVAGYGAIVVKGLCPAIKNANANMCSYPEHSLLTLINMPDSISAQTVWFSGVMSIVSKGLGFSIESIQSAPPGAHPELT